MGDFMVNSGEKLAIAANRLKTNSPTLQHLTISGAGADLSSRLRFLLPHINHLAHLRSISIHAFDHVYANEETNEDIGILINNKIPCLKKIEIWSLSAGICGVIAEPLLNNSHIQNLHLGHCQIGDKGAKILARVFHHHQCKLNEIILYKNGIGDSGCCAIMDAVRHNSSLKSLGFIGDDIGVEGCRAIARALQNKSSILQRLQLAQNRNIGNDGCICIANGLAENSSLKALDLKYCSVSNKGWNAMKKALAKNYSLHELNGGSNYVKHLLAFNRDKPAQAQATKTGMFPTQLLSSSNLQKSSSAACDIEMFGKLISFGNLSVLFSFIQECPSFFESYPVVIPRRSKRLKTNRYLMK